MKLTIVRHGRTIENEQDITQGHMNGQLSETGIQQVKKLGERFKNKHFDVIYCSDLQRTKDTCKAILKYHPDIPVHYTTELRERCKGVYEGKPRDKNYWKGMSEEEMFLDRPEGGESHKDLHERLLKFHENILQKHSDESVLYVTHGKVIVHLFAEFLELKTHDERLKYVATNTAVSIIEVDENLNHDVKVVNCVNHL